MQVLVLLSMFTSHVSVLVEVQLLLLSSIFSADMPDQQLMMAWVHGFLPILLGTWMQFPPAGFGLFSLDYWGHLENKPVVRKYSLSPSPPSVSSFFLLYSFRFTLSLLTSIRFCRSCSFNLYNYFQINDLRISLKMIFLSSHLLTFTSSPNFATLTKNVFCGLNCRRKTLGFQMNCLYFQFGQLELHICCSCCWCSVGGYSVPS